MAHVLEHVEKLRELNTRKYGGLAHEFGAGAACKKCGNSCPGFELHYWRKICLNCRCSKEEHNIDETLLRDKIRWNQVGDLVSRNNGEAFTAPRKFILDAASIRDEGDQQRARDKRRAGSVDSTIELDWAPPNANPELVRLYFSSVPKDQWPVAGTEAAKKRRKNLEQQLPLQDIAVECLVDSKPEERSGLQKYIDQLGTGIIGQAQIIRLERPKVEHVPGNVPSMASRIYHDPMVGAMSTMALDSSPQQHTHRRYERTPTTSLHYQQQVQQHGAMAEPWSNVHENSPPRKVPPAVPPKPLRAKAVSQRHGVGFHYGGEQQVAPGLQQPGVALGGAGHCSNYPDLLGSTNQPDYMKEFAHVLQGSTKSPQGALGHFGHYSQEAQMAPSRPHYAEVSGMPPQKLQEHDSNEEMSPSTGQLGQKGTLFGRQNTHPRGSPKFAESMSQASVFPGQSGSALKGRLTSSYLDPMRQSQEAEEAVPCMQCKKPVYVGDVAVAIPHIHPDLVWHPACFICCTCGERLEDLIYCHSGGKVYCARHYGDHAKKIPRCKGCDQLIFAEQFTQAEGYYWHLEHFACWQCDANLGGMHYTSIDGNPHCMPCYMTKETVKCETCLAMIPPGVTRIGIKGAFWHHTPQCFACKTCSKSMIGTQVLCKEAKVFCSVKCRDSLSSLVSTF